MSISPFAPRDSLPAARALEDIRFGFLHDRLHGRWRAGQAATVSANHTRCKRQVLLHIRPSTHPALAVIHVQPQDARHPRHPTCPPKRLRCHGSARRQAVMGQSAKKKEGRPPRCPAPCRELCPGAVHNGIPEAPGRPFAQLSPNHPSIGDSTPIAERWSGTMRAGA